MKKAMRMISVLAAFCLMLSASMTSLAAQRRNYTYTVTVSAGNQGTLSTEDGVSISVDGGGDYKISLEDGGKLVKITGLTADNHVRFLNSAASVPTDSKYYVKGIRIGGRDESVNLAYFTVERDQDYVVAYGIRGNMVQYTVNYQDTAGNQLYPPQVYYGNVGDKPVVAYLYLEGYQPQAYNLTRTLQSDASKNVFTFVYSRIVTPVQGTTGGGTGAGDGTGTPGGGTGTPGGGAAAPTGGGTGTITGGGAATEPAAPVDDQVGPEAADENNTPLPGNEGENSEEPEEPEEPEELVDLDEEETPLENFETGSDSTVTEANSRMWKYTWIAVGIGSMSVMAVAAGAYLYWRMRKNRNTGTDDFGERD